MRDIAGILHDGKLCHQASALGTLKMAATGGKLLAGRLALVTGKIGENISNKIELFSYIG